MVEDPRSPRAKKHDLAEVLVCLIAGYVTRTKGVSIHRADCLIYQRIPHKEERSVEVQWDE